MDPDLARKDPLMGGIAIIVAIIAVALLVAAFVFFSGVATKLRHDQTEGNLPSQGSDERPEHLAVGTDTEDESVSTRS